MSGAAEVVVAAALLVVPGGLLALAAGLRGWLAAGSAPLLTLGAVAVLAPVLRAVGVGWTPGSALVGLAVLLVVVAAVVLLAALVSRRRGRRAAAAAAPADGPADDTAGRPSLLRRLTAPRGWVPLVSVAAAAVLGGSAVWRATRGLGAVNQSWDAQFHSSAIRLISETGLSAPSALAAVGQPGNATFYYPNNYHLLGALQLDLLGGSATTVVNAMAACLPAALALALTAVLAGFGWSTRALTVGALAAVSVSALPYNIVVYGALLPFAVATCAAPALLALTERVLAAPSVGAAVAGGVGAAGLVATHPSVAVVLAIWCGAHLVVGLTVRRLRTAPVWRALAVLVVIAAVTSLPLLNGLRSSSEVASTIRRTPFTDGGGAVGQLLFFSTNVLVPQWWLGIALVVGLVLLRRRRELWSSYAVALVLAGLFVLSAAYDSSLTSLWWDDASRFAALFVMPALVFVVGAVAAGADALDRLARRVPRVQRSRRPVVLTALSGLLVVVLGLVITSGAYVQRQVDYLSLGYKNGPTLSRGEEGGFRFLSRQAPGGTVMNDPQDGSPYAYAIDDLPVVFKAPITPPIRPDQIGADRVLLFDDFHDLGRNPAVAAAVDRLDVRWVIVGTGFLDPGMERAPGLTDLDQVSQLTKVFDNGNSQVYAVSRSGLG